MADDRNNTVSSRSGNVSTKLGEVEINGQTVSVFKPPHDEPDFPWVDVEELTMAFLSADAAKRMVEHAQRFGGDGERVCATARNGDRIATIICHAMAQGLVGAIDQIKGHIGDSEDGEAHKKYCLAVGLWSAKNYPMSFEQIFYAFKNSGGKFMRDFK